MSPTYMIAVRSGHPIPHDVLVEHIAVALRDFKYAGKVDVKMAHPFDNPNNVKFDDEPQLEEYGGPQPNSTNPTFTSKGYAGRGGYEPAGVVNRGEILYVSDEVNRIGDVHIAGEGCCKSSLPTDPYPLTTRVLDFLRGRRRD